MRLSKLIITIPTYNASPFIADTLKLIQGQTYRDFDVYVIDDCSTDQTCEIVSQFMKEDPRIQLIQNQTNQGLARNWNKCLELAQQRDADYLLIMCQDDMIYPNYIEQKMDIMNSKPSVVMVCNTSDIVNEKSKILFRRRNLKRTIMSGKDCIRKSIYMGNIYGEPSGVLLKVSVTRKAGLFNWDFLYAVDWEYFNRIASYGDVGCVQEPISAFRITSQSSTSKMIADYRRIKIVTSSVVQNAYSILDEKEGLLQKGIRVLLFQCKYWMKVLIIRVMAKGK